MENERMMWLLNRMIEHVAVGRTTKEIIQHLLWLGFTDEELVKKFSFGKADVEDAMSDMDEYEED